MDCLAAGGCHSFLRDQEGKQPLLDRCVNCTPASRAGARVSLSVKHRRACKNSKSCGASSCTPFLDVGRVLSPSRSPASRLVNVCCRSSKVPADQLCSSSSENSEGNRTNYKQNGSASSASPLNRRPKDDAGKDSSQRRSSNITNDIGTGNGFVLAKLSRKNFVEKESASDADLKNDLKNDGQDRNDETHAKRFCTDEFTSEASQSSKDDDQNGGATPPELSSAFEDEADITTGPLFEMHDRVSGKNEPPPFSDPDPQLSHLLASKNIVDFITRFPAWADAQKESGLPKRQQRAFYSHKDWLRHRSSLRYVRHVLSSVSSRVIVSLVPPVFTFTAGAVVVATYNTAVQFGLLPSFFPLLHAASLPYELTAPALALLLVFRTDASYSRYDEARKTWTSVITTTKELARHSVQLIKNPQDMAMKLSLVSYIMAFPISLKCHLIHGSETKKDLECLLQDDDLAFVLSSQHRPNCLIQLMSQSLRLLRLQESERTLLDSYISQYTASVSVCERLIRTPIPLSYTRLTSRFLVLWHMSLPIVLWDACKWLAVPATFFSASTLFCIEEVGVLIEEPFPMLALDKIIHIAHNNIRETIQRQHKTDAFLSQKRTREAADAEK